MPVRYRCRSCGQLLSISRKKIGDVLPCPKCGTLREVPPTDDLEPADVLPAAPPTPPPLEAVPRQSGARRTPLPEAVPAPVGQQRPPVPARDFDDDDDDIEPLEIRFNRRRSFGDDEGMDLTPMVDVTFLLLIFFMITASFQLSKTLPFPSPDPDQKGAAQAMQTLDDLEQTSVIIDIDADGQIYVDDELVPDLAALVNALRDKLIVEQKNEVVILPHRRIPHRTVVAVIDAANEVGMQRIRLSAQGS